MPEQAVSVDQVRRLLDAGQCQEAERLARRLLVGAPAARGEALALLGLAQAGQGQPEVGEVTVRRALTDYPRLAAVHAALGEILRQRRQPAEAVTCFRRALSLAPAAQEYRRQLVVALLATGALAEAAQACNTPLEATSTTVHQRWQLARGYVSLGRLEDARRLYDAVTSEDGSYRDALAQRAYTALAQGELDAARTLLDASLALDPDHADTVRLVAWAQSGRLPPYAPPSWVRREFDAFAPTFDRHLTESLGYASPQNVAAALRRTLGEPRGDRAALDLGCGTGLAGHVLRPYARRLVGVDLSPKMLAEATATGLYDDLIEDELVAFLGATPERFDLVAAADVLVYVGDWQPTFAATAAVLRPGGRFVLTAERHDGDGYVLHEAVRYAHSPAYLERTAADAGLTVELLDDVSPRRDRGKPVPGLLAILRPLGGG